MPFFNFRRDGAVANMPAAPDSVETLRRRARHRLIGSAVLVLIGVIGFPLVFDTQPRPVAVDVPIEIPSKVTVKPLAATGPSVSTATLPADPAAVRPVPVTQPTGTGDKVTAAGSLAPDEEIITTKPSPKSPVVAKAEAIKPKPEAAKPKQESQANGKVIAKPDPKPEAKMAAVDEAARARALLNDAGATPSVRAVDAAATSARMVVQVGAFADVTKAREARAKLEAAGLKTYTQVAETADGKRVRVRVGPFATRVEADKAASKIKTLGLSAAVLTL